MFFQILIFLPIEVVKGSKMAQSEIFLVSSNINPINYPIIIILGHNLLKVFVNFFKSFEFTMCCGPKSIKNRPKWQFTCHQKCIPSKI